MKILITGASGFIGSQLVQAACAEFGQENVLALSSRPNVCCETIVYDINDYSVKPVDLRKFEHIEILIHAGAFIPKNGADVNLISECTKNIYFTEKLLKSPFKNIKKIIYLSTVDVYAAADQINEETFTLPQTLYGMSKLYCENLVTIFSKSEKIDCQILRIGHVYGPGEEKYAKFLPKAIQSIVNCKPVELWGDGAELRTLIYIEDVVTATMASIHLPPDVGIINVVGGHTISIRQLLDAVIALSGKQVEIIIQEFTGITKDYVFDDAKLKAYLLPRETDFLTGLRTEYAHIERLC